MLGSLTPSDYIAVYGAIVATAVALFQIWQQVGNRPKIYLDNEFEFEPVRPETGLTSRREMQYQWEITFSNRGASRTTLLSVHLESIRIKGLFGREVESEKLTPLLSMSYSLGASLKSLDWLPATLENGEACSLKQIIDIRQIVTWNRRKNYLVLKVAHSDKPLRFLLPPLTKHTQSSPEKSGEKAPR